MSHCSSEGDTEKPSGSEVTDDMVVIVVLYAIFTQNSDSFILCINCEHRNKQETGNGGLYIPSLTTNNAMLMILTVIFGVKLDSLRTLTEFG